MHDVFEGHAVPTGGWMATQNHCKPSAMRRDEVARTSFESHIRFNTEPADEVESEPKPADERARVPTGATAVLKLSASAFESPNRNSVNAAVLEARGGGTVRSGVKRQGRSQGVVLPVGRGRVAVFGEAAMFSAQIAGADNTPFGMNVPGIDNRQFALNVMHWLSRLGE
jgi:hypothetical protein